MKLIASVLLVFALLDSVAVAEWPLHQSIYGNSGGPAKTFFDSRGRYIAPTPLYPPAYELHQANGFGRTLPYPSQPISGAHGDARGQKSDGTHKS